MYYYLYFTLKIILAIVLGGVLGWQRVRVGRAAGPRTYALVCAGSTIFTLMSIFAFPDTDSARIAAQIVVGIGFLGAGMIIHKDGGMVEGLTTAAGLWAVAAIGMLVGVGWVWESVIVTALFLFILSIKDHWFVKDKKMFEK